MINKVREAVREKVGNINSHQDFNSPAQKRFFGRKYMSWNASSAALAEVIEYLEELVDLTKLLVGANEFRSGLLIRPSYGAYRKQVRVESQSGGSHRSSKAAEDTLDLSGNSDTIRRRRGTAATIRNSRDMEHEVPISLRRIQSRKTTVSI